MLRWVFNTTLVLVMFLSIMLFGFGWLTYSSFFSLVVIFVSVSKLGKMGKKKILIPLKLCERKRGKVSSKSKHLYCLYCHTAETGLQSRRCTYLWNTMQVNQLDSPPSPSTLTGHFETANLFFILARIRFLYQVTMQFSHRVQYKNKPFFKMTDRTSVTWNVIFISYFFMSGLKLFYLSHQTGPIRFPWTNQKVWAFPPLLQEQNADDDCTFS